MFLYWILTHHVTVCPHWGWKKKKAKIVLLLIETLIWEFLFISHNSVHFQIACFSTTAANDESEVLKEQRGWISSQSPKRQADTSFLALLVPPSFSNQVTPCSILGSQVYYRTVWGGPPDTLLALPELLRQALEMALYLSSSKQK